MTYVHFSDRPLTPVHKDTEVLAGVDDDLPLEKLLVEMFRIWKDRPEKDKPLVVLS